ncbi:MAG TPA: class I SAM-dependent methyltransferase [Vicinamibacterales bacterium]|nr:class I SAM-dependent methyltransferase [Vicinamibacterales bacterium]
MSPELERATLRRDAHDEHKRSEKRAFLSRYVVKGGVGAELGVLWGHFSEVILREFQPRTLYLVDLWDLQGESFSMPGRYSDFGRLRTSDCYDHVRGLAAQHPGVVTVVKDDAANFLTRYAGEPFDWVYVDTSHTYDATLRELTLIAERLAPGGVILGDDWIADPDHPHYEVVQAVHAFVRATEFEIVDAGRGHQYVLRRGERRRSSR